MYAKVLGADHQEKLDAALRAHTVGEEEEDEEEGGEGDRDEGDVEDKAGDKQIVAKESATVMGWKD